MAFATMLACPYAVMAIAMSSPGGAGAVRPIRLFRLLAGVTRHLALKIYFFLYFASSAGKIQEKVL